MPQRMTNCFVPVEKYFVQPVNFLYGQLHHIAGKTWQCYLISPLKCECGYLFFFTASTEKFMFLHNFLKVWK
jgi:hypothetical protein